MRVCVLIRQAGGKGLGVIVVSPLVVRGILIIVVKPAVLCNGNTTCCC